MRYIPRLLVLAPVLLAALAFMPQQASAAVLHVPFDFAVSGRVLPAGNYSVNRDSKGTFVVLTTPDGKRSFNWLIGPGDPDPNQQGIKLRFDSTKSGYALRSIQYSSMITRQLDKNLRGSEDRPVHVIRGE